MLDIFSIISVVGIFLLLFFIVILLRRRVNRRANVVLGLLMAVIALSIFNSGLLYDTNLFYRLPHLVKLSFVWVLLFGPLFLFYIRTLTKNPVRGRRWQALHFSAPVGYALFKLPFFLQSGQWKIAYMRQWMNGTINPGEMVQEYVIGAVLIAHFFVYFVMSMRNVSRYRRRIKSDYSSIEKINLSWIRTFSLICLAAAVAISILAGVLFFAKIGIGVFFRALPACVTLFACLLAYRDLTQQEIPAPVREGDAVPALDPGKNPAATKSERYGLTDQAAAAYLSRLTALMEEERLFTNPNLSLQDLAAALDIPRAYVSSVLNDFAGTTFYEFVNRYRVAEVKRLLAAAGESGQTVLDIAFESGFNSKSTFNSFFKKATGRTPSEYIKG